MQGILNQLYYEKPKTKFVVFCEINLGGTTNPRPPHFNIFKGWMLLNKIVCIFYNKKRALLNLHNMASIIPKYKYDYADDDEAALTAAVVSII